MMKSCLSINTMSYFVLREIRKNFAKECSQSVYLCFFTAKLSK